MTPYFTPFNRDSVRKVLLTCLVLFTSIAASALEVDGISYALNFSSMTAEVEYNSTYSGTSVTIPPSVTYDGETFAVTSIINSAFNSCTAIESVTIGENVTSIGSQAFFGCTALKSVTFGENMTTIDSQAFRNCTALTKVYYKGDVAGWCGIYFANYSASPLNNGAELYIGESADLATEITIPKGVESIGQYAFPNCTSLTSVTFSDESSVESIETYAFYGCTSLKTITLPESVTSIGNYAFYGCSSLQTIDLSACTSLTSIDYAFRYCEALESVTLPSSLTYISSGPFEGCSNLTSITVDENNAAYSSREGVVYSKDMTTLVLCPMGRTSVTIPDGVTSIQEGAFWSCAKLESVTIPDGVTSIGYNAFVNCKSLTSINIPEGVTIIDGFTFQGCTALTSVTLPSALTEIRQFAFSSCESLTSITIPEGVTAIDECAFYNCTALAEIICLNTTPPECGNGVFDEVDTDNCLLVVHDASKDAYASADTWQDFSQIVGLSTTAIGSVAAETGTGGRATETARHALDGSRISAPRKGVNIIRLSDGSVRKVVVK